MRFKKLLELKTNQAMLDSLANLYYSEDSAQCKLEWLVVVGANPCKRIEIASLLCTPARIGTHY